MIRLTALAFAAVLIASACGAEPDSAACAAKSGAAYEDQAEVYSWPVYCPTFLPPEFVLESASFADPDSPMPDALLSTVKFVDGDDNVITVFQGFILIAPRDERGLPVASIRESDFGDMPAKLYIIELNVPLIRSSQASGPTRAIRGSPGLDPAILVAVAAGMQRIES